MTMKLDRWIEKQQQQGTSSNAMSSFVRYFKTISEWKLELQSGNAQFE